MSTSTDSDLWNSKCKPHLDLHHRSSSSVRSGEKPPARSLKQARPRSCRSTSWTEGDSQCCGKIVAVTGSSPGSHAAARPEHIVEQLLALKHELSSMSRPQLPPHLPSSRSTSWSQGDYQRQEVGAVRSSGSYIGCLAACPTSQTSTQSQHTTPQQMPSANSRPAA